MPQTRLDEHGLTVAGHLGGYHRKGDPGSDCREMWEYVIDLLGIRSVLDVGCGPGLSLDVFEEYGCLATGIEGVKQRDPRIIQHDYSRGPCSVPLGAVDMIWSCEFVEHVDERHLPNFLHTFHHARKLVLMTHAVPGQSGHHHVNCQPAHYWIGALAAASFRFDLELTLKLRHLCTRGQYFARTGLAFFPAA